MLQSFQGPLDAHGLRSLRLEGDDSGPRIHGSKVGQFWAVLHSDELPTIRAALCAGDRRTALLLICERSFSIGSILPQ